MISSMVSWKHEFMPRRRRLLSRTEVEDLARKQPSHHPSKKRKLDDNQDLQGPDLSVHPEPHSGESHLLASQTILAVPDMHLGSTYLEEAPPVNNAPAGRWTESQPSLFEKMVNRLTKRVPRAHSAVELRCAGRQIARFAGTAPGGGL